MGARPVAHTDAVDCNLVPAAHRHRHLHRRHADAIEGPIVALGSPIGWCGRVSGSTHHSDDAPRINHNSAATLQHRVRLSSP